MLLDLVCLLDYPVRSGFVSARVLVCDNCSCAANRCDTVLNIHNNCSYRISARACVCR